MPGPLETRKSMDGRADPRPLIEATRSAAGPLVLTRDDHRSYDERQLPRTGDVLRPYYEDEAVALYLGDCLDVLPMLGQVDHVLTDPPYARDVYGRMSSAIGAFGMGKPRPGLTKMAAGAIGQIDDILNDVAVQIARVATRWVLVFSDVESCWRWRRELEAAGLRYVRTGAWVKPDAMPQMSGDRPGVGFEPVTICHAQGAMRWNGGGSRSVWTYNTVKGTAKYRPDHPCPKPESLMLELVQQFTDPGETILDPFAGSGTTLVAAKRLGRKAIGIETHEPYADVVARRLSQGALDLWPGDTRAAP